MWISYMSKNELKEYLVKNQKVKNKMMSMAKIENKSKSITETPVKKADTSKTIKSKLLYSMTVPRRGKYLIRAHMAKQEMELPQGSLIEIYGV